MRIIEAPPGMPVQSWSVVGPHAPTITGFPSADAAHAWATEWCVCPQSVVAPVCGVADATRALIAYEMEASEPEVDPL